MLFFQDQKIAACGRYYMGFVVFLRACSCCEINCSYTVPICAIFSRLAFVGVV